MGVRQRVQQGLRDLLSFTQTIDEALLNTVLTPEQRALFGRMTHAEQLHSLHVLRTVLAQIDTTPPDLKVAALLHDVGKARYPLNVAQRSLAVVIKHLLPAASQRWSATERLDRWHAPFVVRQHHPRWSAELAQTAEASPCALWLIAHHADPSAMWQTHEYYPLLVRLQAADDAN